MTSTATFITLYMIQQQHVYPETLVFSWSSSNSRSPLPPNLQSSLPPLLVASVDHLQQDLTSQRGLQSETHDISPSCHEATIANYLGCVSNLVPTHEEWTLVALPTRQPKSRGGADRRKVRQKSICIYIQFYVYICADFNLCLR